MFAKVLSAAGDITTNRGPHTRQCQVVHAMSPLRARMRSAAYILYPPAGLAASCSALQMPRAASLPGPASSVAFLSGLSLAPDALSSSSTFLATWFASSLFTQMTLSRPLTGVSYGTRKGAGSGGREEGWEEERGARMQGERANLRLCVVAAQTPRSTIAPCPPLPQQLHADHGPAMRTHHSARG